MEYRITITFAYPGFDPEVGERALAQLEAHLDELGPVVSQEPDKVIVIVACDAPDARIAVDECVPAVIRALGDPRHVVASPAYGAVTELHVEQVNVDAAAA